MRVCQFRHTCEYFFNPSEFYTAGGAKHTVLLTEAEHFALVRFWYYIKVTPKSQDENRGILPTSRICPCLIYYCLLKVVLELFLSEILKALIVEI